MAYKTSYITPGIAALQVEVSKHPEVLALAENVNTFSEAIGAIAAHVDIALDGYYSVADLDVLCFRIRDRLQARRGAIVGVNGKTIQ